MNEPSDSTQDSTNANMSVVSHTGAIQLQKDRVILNGVSYDISQAKIYVNGSLSDSTVSGTESPDGNGTATEIHSDIETSGSVLENKVDKSGNGTLNVMGQTVHVDSSTVFESYDVADSSAADIEKDNVVEVSGYTSGDGEIWGTRVEVKNLQYNPGETTEVKGYVSNLNNNTFQIGNLTINTENAVMDVNFQTNPLQDGQYVEVKSSLGIDANGALQASAIKLESDAKTGKTIPHSENAEKVKIQGVVTDASKDNSIEVNGSQLVLAANSNTANQSTPLTVGTHVDVEGYVDSDHKLVATQLKASNSPQTSSDSSIDSQSSSDSSNGTDDSVKSNDSSLTDKSNSDNSLSDSNETSEHSAQSSESQHQENEQDRG